MTKNLFARRARFYIEKSYDFYKQGFEVQAVSFRRLREQWGECRRVVLESEQRRVELELEYCRPQFCIYGTCTSNRRARGLKGLGRSQK